MLYESFMSRRPQHNTLSISQPYQGQYIVVQEIRIANINCNTMHPSLVYKCLHTLTSFTRAFHIGDAF